MKRNIVALILIGICALRLNAIPIVASAGNLSFEARMIVPKYPSPTYLTQRAFTILDAKCNVCHRKQNPFRVFSLKNMEKNAKRIHEQVFLKQRMPKGDEIKLTQAEYRTLEAWLETQGI
ncbi:MAG: hypothetical protein AAGI38_07910 [Bacteroidota bacterium]